MPVSRIHSTFAVKILGNDIAVGPESFLMLISLMRLISRNNKKSIYSELDELYNDEEYLKLIEELRIINKICEPHETKHI